MTDSPSRLDRYAPLVAGLVIAIPTLAAYYPPMSDLGLHEGVVGILRHWGDEAYFPRGLYVLNLGHSNQLFHVSAALLAFVFDTRWALKIIIALAQVLIFHSGARFADHIGRSRWSALLLAPLALGFTYHWGLVANLVGYAAFLYALPAIDRFVQSPTVRAALLISALLVLLFFAHGSVFVTATAVIGFFTFCHPLDRRRTTIRLLPVAFAAVFSAGHLLWERSLFTAGQVPSPTSFLPFLLKLRYFPNALFGSHELFAQLLLLALCVVALAALLVTRFAETREGDETRLGDPAAESGLRRARGWIYRHRFAAIGVAYLVGYFVMPFNWRGTTLLHERFLGPAWALLVLSAAPRGIPSRLAKLTSAVVPLSILVVTWPQFLDSDQSGRDLGALMEEIPKGSAVAACIVDRSMFATRVYSASVSVARTVAVRGGRMGMSLTISPISPVQVNPAYRWDEYETRTFIFGSSAMKPEHDLDRFGWILAQSRAPHIRAFLLPALYPDAVLVDARGEWMLFRSRHELVPLTSGDVPLPRKMDSVADRLMRLERAAAAQ